MQDFNGFGLLPPLSAGLTTAGYTTPTPIQAQALPAALAGRDVLGLAQTGTGKTAAFALPVLQALAKADKRARPGHPRALIVLPTRELALQVGTVFDLLGVQLPFTNAVVHGGVSLNPQIKALAAGVDILIATPGRLIDLMDQGKCKLDSVVLFVLDEADRMLDMGFLPAVKKLVAKLPKTGRQTMFFSATMPNDVSGLAESLLHNHVRVEVTPPATTVERIDQSVIFLDMAQKAPTLVKLLSDPAVETAIIFTRTKHGANKLAAQLAGAGLGADAYHANKSQNARERALDAFRAGKTRALVATDIAARGIDVDLITHVFNFDLPEVPDAYVHRIGRTGRAGRAGTAVSLVAPADRPLLKQIEKVTRQSIPRHPMEPAAAALLPQLKPERPPQPQPKRARPKPAGAADGQPRQGNRPPRPDRDRQQPQGQRRADGPRPDGARPDGARADGPRNDRPRTEQPAARSGEGVAQQQARPQQPRPQGQRPAQQGKPQQHSRPGGHGKPQGGDRPQGQKPAPKQGNRPQGQRPAREVTEAGGSGDWTPEFLRRPARG
ncbi:DEAD/DEAH box helicase [Niveispirillum sp. KHB5.9]|uniref:DEAD/DEAH box helicase n=1 Tax=Niveispirillum sp. KHB5.9 TaxID=3400269 RepID=UPI003A8BC15D